MAKKEIISFNHFLEKFPEIELPVTLSADTHHTFDKNNDPLPKKIIEEFLVAIEEDVDEFTEFIACFRIPATYEFHGVVYWKAGLMNYQYILATFTKQAVLIDKKTIAGTYSDGDLLVRSVTTIDDDWMIHIVSGKINARDNSYDASSSKAYKLELMPTGEIIIATDDDD